MPTLGQLAGIFANGGTGWGQVRPAEISNGGDPTGMVSDISWISWGEAQAIGSGTGDYVGQGQTVAQGSTEAARVIAFDPGMCDGRYMYRAVEWFFPQHGQSFDPDRFEDICTGQYFPLQSGRYTNRTGSQQSGYYAIDATTKGAALTGVLSYMNSDGSDLPVFNFTGTIGVDGSLSIRSSPDTHPSQSLTGSWNTLSFTLDDCARVLTLQSQPPCTFNP